MDDNFNVYISYLGILFQQFGEVLKERVLGSEKIKLIVALFSVHQVGQKLAAVTSDKLCSQLHNVPENGGKL